MPRTEVNLATHAPEISDSEESLLCESELELEMAWGDGPIAPLRTETPAPRDEAIEKSTSAGAQQRPCSSRNGCSRASTPKRRGSESPLAGNKRLMNIHPIRSAGYLSNPNELPLGARKQQRWLNDHHFGNRAASTRVEDLMEHMTIDVEWRSNFKKLAEPQNEDLQTEFRQGGGESQEHNVSHGPRNRRKDKWNDAEQMFTRVDRRARTLILRSLTSLAPFIEAVECVVLHFIQWREVPSELEIPAPLLRMLKHPIELVKVGEKDVRLIMPLLDSAFHRLIIHSVCQFYVVRSRTELNRRLNTKIMVLKSPKKRSSVDDLAQVSLCDFIRETRVARRHGAVSSLAKVTDSCYALELQSKSSECSEGFCLVEAPQV